MNEIIQLFEFFAFCLSQLWLIMDSVSIGNHTILSIVVSMGYISITFWGIFSLLNNSNENDNGDD